MKVCESCGAQNGSAFGLLDYCAICSRDLCPGCMGTGCCGHVPAMSGQVADAGEEDYGCCPSCGACPSFIGSECDGDCEWAMDL